MDPELETQGEASSVQQEEATNGDGTPPLPVEDESLQDIQELPDRLREAEKENTELRQENTELRQENTELSQENDELKRLLKEHGIPWESTPVDIQKKYPPAA